MRLPADSRCRLGLVLRVAEGGCGKPTVGVWVRPKCVKGVWGCADGGQNRVWAVCEWGKKCAVGLSCRTDRELKVGV